MSQAIVMHTYCQTFPVERVNILVLFLNQNSVCSCSGQAVFPLRTFPAFWIWKPFLQLIYDTQKDQCRPMAACFVLCLIGQVFPACYNNKTIDRHSERGWSTRAHTFPLPWGELFHQDGGWHRRLLTHRVWIQQIQVSLTQDTEGDIEDERNGNRKQLYEWLIYEVR